MQLGQAPDNELISYQRFADSLRDRLSKGLKDDLHHEVFRQFSLVYTKSKPNMVQSSAHHRNVGSRHPLRAQADDDPCLSLNAARKPYAALHLVALLTPRIVACLQTRSRPCGHHVFRPPVWCSLLVLSLTAINLLNIKQ